ncbi:MAG: hypothetical protein ACTSUV_05155 [Candidatus Ranarchaeia archaeon]
MSDKSLLEKFLHNTVTNEYKDHRIAYYGFIFITLLTIVRSLIHIFVPDGGV